MQSETLKPCPRCNNRAFIAHGNAPSVNGYPVWCATDRCLQLPPRASEAEAVAAWNERPHIAAQDAEIARLKEAVKVLRDGYADAVSGYEYITQQYGRLAGVGFDRVTDHFFEHVTVPEREGLLAGSHWLPAIVKTETPHAK